MKPGRVLAPICAAMMLASSCASESQSAGELQEVKVATVLSGQSGYLAALIEEKGIAAKHGLKIENLAMDFTEAANALKLGRADASTMQPSTAVRLRKDGNAVQILVPQLWSGNAWVVRKDSPYRTIEDLRGKKIGNFSRVTGAYFFSAVIAKERGLDVERDFQSLDAETGALMGLLERGDVEAINMFEPHVTKLLLTGKYRVLLDFDTEMEKIFGAPPLKTGVAVQTETVENNPEMVKALRAAYLEGIEYIKSGKDEEFFRDNAQKYFGLSGSEEIEASFERNRENFVGETDSDFTEAQNEILTKGIELGLLPDAGDLTDLWVK
ncbi:MAG: PhnD/SsuA/transferrin family substrate-binding protein [Streptosporangiales bacterium]|nr:PhnD/SsuA/transferrin family substrate-binding protein [Streptosporangiales bacterium]